jgi:predicted nucleotidyltransferase
LRDLFAAESRRTQDVTADLVEGIPEALSIILFGSEARGQAKPESDTDLLIVVARKEEYLSDKIVDACMHVAEKHDLALSWHIADLADLNDWEATGHEFWRNVQEDGVVLYGHQPEDLRPRWKAGRAT